MLAEYDNGAAVTSPSREYIYAGSQLVAKVEAGATNYFHPDHLSTRVNTDSTGAVSRTFGQYPFGEVWYETGTANKLKFTTYERDSESGNDYALARSYINRYARFSSPDPLSGSLADPQSLNRYAYSRNDAISLYDPSGMWTAVPQGCTVDNSQTVGQDLHPGTISCPPFFSGADGPIIHCTFGVTNGIHTICNDPNDGRGNTSDLLAGVTITGIGPDPDAYAKQIMQRDCAEQAGKAVLRDLVHADEIDAVGNSIEAGSIAPLKALITGDNALTAVEDGADKIAQNRIYQKGIKAATNGLISANSAGRIARRVGKLAAAAGYLSFALDAYEAYNACMAN